jgi:hypothetical protein
VNFFQFSSTFAMVAVWTGSNNICPQVFSPQVFGPNMVNGQVVGMPPTILACIPVPAKDLPAGQLDLQAGTVNHLFQPDDRRNWNFLPDSLNITTPIHDQISLPQKDQANCAAGVTDVYRFKISVKYKYWRVHSASTLA